MDQLSGSRPVRFCSKAGIRREWILPKPCYHRDFYKSGLESRILDCSR
jgi:hypothetical protein